MLKNIVKLCLAFSFIAFSVGAYADKWQPTLNQDQKQLLGLAYDVGLKVGYPETLQFILMQETLAGKIGRVGDDGQSLGVMQIQVAAARDISNYYDELPVLTDAEYKYHLKHSDGYAMLVSAYIVKYAMDFFDGDWRRGLIAYNRGITGASRMTDSEIEQHYYMVGVKDKAPIVRAFNEARGAVALASNE